MAVSLVVWVVVTNSVEILDDKRFVEAEDDSTVELGTTKFVALEPGVTGNVLYPLVVRLISRVEKFKATPPVGFSVTGMEDETMSPVKELDLSVVGIVPVVFGVVAFTWSSVKVTVGVVSVTSLVPIG